MQWEMVEIIRIMRRWVVNENEWEKAFQVGEQKGTGMVH